MCPHTSKNVEISTLLFITTMTRRSRVQTCSSLNWDGGWGSSFDPRVVREGDREMVDGTGLPSVYGLSSSQ